MDDRILLYPFHAVPIGASPDYGFTRQISAANAANLIALDHPCILHGVAWSFNQPPAADVTLQISNVNGIGVIFEVYITQDGPGVVYFQPGMRSGLPGTALTINISAGGAGIISTLNVLGYVRIV